MRRNLLLLCLVLLTLCLPARADAPAAPAVGDEQQEAIRKVLHGLYDAYKAKDAPQVMRIIHEAVESSARDYASRHPDDKGAADAIRDAFLAFHEDIFQHEAYNLLDYNDGFADFVAQPDGSVEVTSSVPIISSDAMTFTGEDGTPTTVRLRLGRFVLRPDGEVWQIVEMNLF